MFTITAIGLIRHTRTKVRGFLGVSNKKIFIIYNIIIKNAPPSLRKTLRKTPASTSHIKTPLRTPLGTPQLVGQFKIGASMEAVGFWG